MKIACLGILLCALAFGWAFRNGASQQTMMLERTVMLERFADRLERAKDVNPDTYFYVKNLIINVEKQPARDDKLKQRQTVVINRINAALSDHTAALRQNPATQ